MIIGYIVLLIARIINNSAPYDFYPNILTVIGFVVLIPYGISVAPISYIYAIEVLPERGLAVLMIFHWIGIYFMNFPFVAYFSGDSIFNYEVLAILYTFIYLAFAIAVNIK